MGERARRRVVDEDREPEKADRAGPRERTKVDVVHRDPAREVDLVDDELAASSDRPGSERTPEHEVGRGEGERGDEARPGGRGPEGDDEAEEAAVPTTARLGRPDVDRACRVSAASHQDAPLSGTAEQISASDAATATMKRVVMIMDDHRAAGPPA